MSKEYQAVVRVRHAGLDLSKDGNALDAVSGELTDYGATAQLWPDMSEWTLTVLVPSLWDVGAVAGRAVRAAYEQASVRAVVVRADAWNADEWEREKGLTE